jgi:DNA-binding transcriptional LysR family regulator
MNATFRQLRLFLAFAELRSVTAAARACHVTQPTASMQLRELSSAVGVPLYEQLGKQMYLTAAGEALARSARVMMDEWASFEQVVDGLKGVASGRLKLSIVSTAKYFMPRLLGTFCAAHPDVDIALEVLNRDRVVQRLGDNLDDMYVMSMPPEGMALERQELMANPLVVIAERGHALAARQLAPAGLAAPLHPARKGSGTRLAGDRHLRALGVAVDVRMELGSNEAIKQAVAAGLGPGHHFALRAGGRSGRRGTGGAGRARFPDPVQLVDLVPPGKKLSPLAAAFLQHVCSVQKVSRQIVGASYKDMADDEDEDPVLAVLGGTPEPPVTQPPPPPLTPCQLAVVDVLDGMVGGQCQDTHMHLSWNEREVQHTQRTIAPQF